LPFTLEQTNLSNAEQFVCVQLCTDVWCYNQACDCVQAARLQLIVLVMTAHVVACMQAKMRYV